MATAMDMDTVTAMATTNANRTGRSRDSGRTPNPMRGALCVLPVVLLLASSGAGAGNWLFTETTEVALTAVDRTGDSEYNGTVLQATPNLRFSGESGRSRANIDYRPTFSVGGGTTDPKFLTHQLIGRGRLEVVPDNFLLGATASARLLSNDSTAGNVDAININADGGQSYSFGLQPEFRFHLNQYADLVSLNSFDLVTYSGENLDNQEDSTRGLLHIGARNGKYFGPLSLKADARYERTDYESRTDKRSEVSAGADYQFSSQLNAGAEFGYETNDIQTSRSDTDGPFWQLRAGWNPSPRTVVSGLIGQRYFGPRLNLQVQHTSRRTKLSLGLSRDVDNRRTEQLVDSFFFVADSEGNPVLDPLTGNPVVVEGQALEQVDEDFITERLRGAILVSGRRTSFNLRGAMSRRNYEVSDSDEDSYDLGFDVNRLMGNKFRASISGNYQLQKNTAFGDSDYYDLRVSLNRSIGRNSGAGVNLSHHERDAEDQGRSYTENRVGISLFTSFL